MSTNRDDDRVTFCQTVSGFLGAKLPEGMSFVLTIADTHASGDMHVCVGTNRDPELVAAMMREMADQIERGSVTMHEAPPPPQ